MVLMSFAPTAVFVAMPVREMAELVRALLFRATLQRVLGAMRAAAHIRLRRVVAAPTHCWVRAGIR